MNHPSSSERVCPTCGTPLAENTAEGLCPACLLALSLATQTECPEEVGPNGTRKVRPQPTSPPTPAEIASQFPQFQILECLGRGGMGVVYRARQKSLDRFVALKILAPEREKDPEFAERFAREAKTLAQLNHPNIVTVHDFGEVAGMFFLVMEFVDGVNLRRLLQERKLSPEEALAIVPPVCEALQYAHQQGVIHRDIKPENLLLDKQGRIKIADFGIAKILGRMANTSPSADSSGLSVAGPEGQGAGQGPPGDSQAAQPGPSAEVTDVGNVLGTPQYMAPEQTTSPQRVDHRADIYSLGVVLYEMLTGELPATRLQPPSRKVQVDVRIDEIVLRALEKEPERRYQTATQFKTMVETIASDAGTPNVPNPKSERNTRLNAYERRRKGMLLYGLIASLIGLPIGLALQLPYVWGLSIAGILIAIFKLSMPVKGTSKSDSTIGRATREPRGRMPLAAGHSYNPWETTTIAAGTVLFIVLFLMALEEWSRPFRLPLIVMCLLGLGICAVSIAGLWPFPSPLFPEPNFSSRNLRRRQKSAGSPQTANPPPAVKGKAWPWVLGCLGGALLLGVLLIISLLVYWGSSRARMAEAARQAQELQQRALVAAAAVQPSRESTQDFIAFHPATNGTAALDAARDFVIEHGWTLEREEGNDERVRMHALDADRKKITFEEALQSGGMARFTVRAESGAEITARRIGSELWHRLGWGDLNSAEAFGPVIERRLTPKSNEEPSFIDLDENRMPPDPSLGDWEAVYAWAASNGVDAVVAGQNEVQGLVGWDMRVLEVASNTWDHITPSALANSLEPARPHLHSPMCPRNKQPATYLFQTREGGRGILQIASFSEDPPSAMLRYKLVHAEGSAPSAGTVERDTLQARLRAAHTLQARLRAALAKRDELELQVETGRVPGIEVAKAKGEVAALEAQLDGDERRAALIRLESARAELGVKRQQFEAGLLSRAEVVAAETAVQLRELDLQRVEASDPLTAGVQSLEPKPTPPTQSLGETNEAVGVSEGLMRPGPGPTGEVHTNRSPSTRSRLFLVGPFLLMALSGLAALVGGAAWWIIAGRKTGRVVGRTALTLATGGPLFAAAGCLVLGQVGIDVALFSLPLLLACEIPALCLGVMSRRTGLGKAALVVSVTIIVVSLVLVA